MGVDVNSDSGATTILYGRNQQVESSMLVEEMKWDDYDATLFLPMQ
jgi:hypothetical protein